MPYSKWMLNELRDLFENTLSFNKLDSTGLFNAKSIKKIWEEHISMKFDHGRALWGILNYMLWHEIYIEKKNFQSYILNPRKSIHNNMNHK